MPTYLVTQFFTKDPKAEGQSRERLIEAVNRSAAIRHVAAATITAEPCGIEDAMRLAKAGCAVEKAGE